jgi:hypothetical protein
MKAGPIRVYAIALLTGLIAARVNVAPAAPLRKNCRPRAFLLGSDGGSQSLRASRVSAPVPRAAPRTPERPIARICMGGAVDDSDAHGRVCPVKSTWQW